VTRRRWYVLHISRDRDGKVQRVSTLNGLAGSERKPGERELEAYRREYERPPLQTVRLVSASSREAAILIASRE
jgi:hypothetical protein